MEQKNPIYSEETRCRDCYRCIRECPVKAIRVVDGEAEVVPDRCILCGRCVEVCPVGAKKIRDDLRRVLHLLKRKSRVILSLAPSFAGEFRGILPEQIVSAAKVLGFFGVSETALGAEEVSAALRQNLTAENKPMTISTACPSAVELVRKYYPEFTQNLSELHSPLLSHCVMLKKIYGSDIGIVFAGPCVAKKKEADQFPDLLDIAITFNDLKHWFNSSCIDLRQQVTDENDVFIPRNSENGSLYPIEGGMISTLSGKDCGYRYMTLSGISTIQRAFDEMSGTRRRGRAFSGTSRLRKRMHRRPRMLFFDLNRLKTRCSQLRRIKKGRARWALFIRHQSYLLARADIPGRNKRRPYNRSAVFNRQVFRRRGTQLRLLRIRHMQKLRQSSRNRPGGTLYVQLVHETARTEES